MRLLSLCLRGDCLQGDNHIIILGANHNAIYRSHA
jgi:hypothetical protein